MRQRHIKAEKEDLTGILEWLKSDVAGKMTSKKGISKNLMLLQSWNEYGEGHYMMPTVSDGFTYLDAVRGKNDNLKAWVTPIY